MPEDPWGMAHKNMYRKKIAIVSKNMREEDREWTPAKGVRR